MLEEVIKLYRFAGISPEQFFTEARSHREAVVAADQRMVSLSKLFAQIAMHDRARAADYAMGA